VPGLIGPLKIDTTEFVWKRFSGDDLVETFPISKALTLWDGGVYDNLGIEALYKIGSGPRENIDFLLISDASAPITIKKRTWIEKIPLPGSPTRLVDIPADQVRSVRSREIFRIFKQNSNGGYIRMGETISEIARNLDTKEFEERNIKCALNSSAVKLAANFKTTLRKVTPHEFELMFRHGYETCSAVLTGAAGLKYCTFDRTKFDFLPGLSE
jgi:NTE family protein